MHAVSAHTNLRGQAAAGPAHHGPRGRTRWHAAAALLLALAGTWLQPVPAAAAGPAAGALRIASAFDPQTMDPHAVALLYHSRIAFQVHDALLNRDADFKLEPALATRWQMTGPTTWRFSLRSGVKFHDGSPFTADDAIFSIQRAQGPTSQRAFTLQGIAALKKVDALTIDIQLTAPDAVLPEKLLLVAMVSQAWCRQHGVEKAQDFNGKQETFAVRNANGTGPYRLVAYQPDVQVQLARHDGWWGRADARNGNVAAATFLTIRSDATRLAALASGEVDLVLDPPFQDVARLQRDVRLRVVSTTDQS